MQDILVIRYNDEGIIKRRKQVANLFIQQSVNVKSPDIKEISDQDLRILFELYDEVFFQDWFAGSFQGTLRFSLSRRMTRSAGITSCPRNIDPAKPSTLLIKVKISIDFISHYGSIEGANSVAGIAAENSLEALQLILEHELIHVIEFIHFGRSSCKGKRFKVIAHNLFGHTASYHQLPTHQEIARQKLGVVPGDRISFEFEGRHLDGIVHKINKRATVMVADRGGSFVDKKGKRYTKYYVPLSIINKI